MMRLYYHFLLCWSLATFAFLLLPILIVIPISFSSAPYLQFPPPGFSFQWFERVMNDGAWLSAAWRSLYIAFGATIISLVLGTFMSYAIIRSHPVSAKILEATSLAPMAVPQVVYAVAVYGTFVSVGMAGTAAAVILAHAVLAIPFVVVVMASVLKGFDRSQEEAASGLGADRIVVLRRIVLPQLTPAFVTAGFFAFMASFDELVVALFLGGPPVTLPRKMFENIKLEIDPAIAAVSVFQLALLLVLIAVLGRYGESQEKMYGS